MLCRWLRYGDVSRETKQARRELDAIGRAVASARSHGRQQRVLESLDRWAGRVKSFNSQVSE
jgi:hypothetical protein